MAIGAATGIEPATRDSALVQDTGARLARIDVAVRLHLEEEPACRARGSRDPVEPGGGGDLQVRRAAPRPRILADCVCAVGADPGHVDVSGNNLPRMLRLRRHRPDCLFLSLYLWLFRRALRFPHALLLLPVGVLAIWLCNIVRITRLIAIGTSISPGVALGGFHSQAGWLFFLSVSLGLMAAGHSLRLFAAQPLPQSEATSPRGAPDAAALLVPALVLLASIILISAASSGFDRWYPLRLVATAAALWHFYRRGQIGDAVYAHMTTNALIAAYVLCVGRWSLWA
jgi:exosortase/archaeosortase family protein